ncbi:MAG: hypothetical protein WBP26_01475 [Candidatus Saccharimonadales bacterium]
MINNDLDNYIHKYVEGYLFADMQSIKNDVSPDKHPGNGAYTLLLSALSAMEFIGLLMRSELPIRQDEISGDRVDASKGLGTYIKEYLSKIDPNYRVLCEIAPRLIRNGIAHTYATKGNVAITRQGDRDQSHLKVYGTQEILVINVDCLMEDFLKSYNQYVKPHLSKEDALYENINNNYEAIRNVYIGEVNNAMTSSQKQLKKLKHVHKDIDGSLEELEVNGMFILVS